MRSTKKKAVISKKTGMVYANGKFWSKDSWKHYRDYQTDFLRKKYRTFIVRVNRFQEADMVEYMEGQDNLSGYVRELIREEMIKANYQPSEKALELMEVGAIGESIENGETVIIEGEQDDDEQEEILEEEDAEEEE